MRGRVVGYTHHLEKSDSNFRNASIHRLCPLFDTIVYIMSATGHVANSQTAPTHNSHT